MPTTQRRERELKRARDALFLQARDCLRVAEQWTKGQLALHRRTIERVVTLMRAVRRRDPTTVAAYLDELGTLIPSLRKADNWKVRLAPTVYGQLRGERRDAFDRLVRLGYSPDALADWLGVEADEERSPDRQQLRAHRLKLRQLA